MLQTAEVQSRSVIKADHRMYHRRRFETGSQNCKVFLSPYVLLSVVCDKLINAALGLGMTPPDPGMCGKSGGDNPFCE